jgi:amino acid transporter
MSAVPRKSLSLFDAVCLIVGVIIGAGIYETTPAVADSVGGPVGVFFIWLAGGLLALCGALCYAELAAAYPYQGGDYVYLNRAYHPAAGFMFGWTQLVIIRPGDIALMAYVFARYAASLYSPSEQAAAWYAAAAVTALTLINAAGVREGKNLQNLLTLLKLFGLAGIVFIGWTAPGAVGGGGAVSSIQGSGGTISLALILVLFTYGGWSEIAYVAAEIKKPKRNIPRALMLGTLVVTIFYLLLNAVFMHALGYDGLRGSDAVAVDAVAAALPGWASRLVGIIICISALGSVNGLIFSGARITYALGSDYAVFHRIGRWHARLGTPVAALLMQGLISLCIVLLAGSFMDTLLYSAPAVWFFFLASGLALFRLRRADAARTRPWKVIGYPFVPAAFCVAAGFMLCSSVVYACTWKPAGLIVLLAVMGVGAALYAVAGRKTT